MFRAGVAISVVVVVPQIPRGAGGDGLSTAGTHRHAPGDGRLDGARAWAIIGRRLLLESGARAGRVTTTTPTTSSASAWTRREPTPAAPVAAWPAVGWAWAHGLWNATAAARQC